MKLSRGDGADRSDDHRLAFLDQTALELRRVTGRNQLVQCVWVYERPIDYEGLNRFNRNLHESMGGRLIERSLLPFGRPRWIRPGGEPNPIHIAKNPRPREELLQWADELGSLPLDPEAGPAYSLAVQSFTDGCTAVGLTGSHVLIDGIGSVMIVFEAVTGNIHPTGYDMAQSRSVPESLAEDLLGAVRDVPLTLRTMRKAITMVRTKRAEFSRARAAQTTTTGGSQVTVPSVATSINASEWDARAEALGGNSYSLLAGFCAKLAEHLDRRRASDGKVSLLIAINTRESLEDDRALAMAFANATVDPAKVTVDLTETRAAVKASREKAKAEPDPTMELLPLLPWLPRGAVKGVADLLFSYSEDLPVSCSNLGELPPEISQADGSPADYVYIRAFDTDVTEGELERSKGQLVVVSGRVNGKISISVEAYQLGAENSKARLTDLMRQTLAEFGLSAVVE